MRTLARLLLVSSIVLAASPASAQHTVSQERSPRFHLTGAIGTTAALFENTALAATTIDARFYAPEGLGVAVRLGYEGLFILNYGVLDVGVAYRRELPERQWAALGLGFALGFSGMLRDSVYQFTGDDTAFALFGTVGVDVRLGSLLIGLDVIGRWQLAAEPTSSTFATRGSDWAELGGAIRIGGEVLL